MPQGARKAARDGAQGLQRAEDHEWVDHAVRLGLIAYGVVHLLIAWLAHQLAEQPFGAVGLWLVAIGMLLLVAWRLLEAAVGHRDKDGRERVQASLVSVLKAVLYGSIGVTAVRIAVGNGGGKGSGGTDGTTATLLQLPGGQVIVFVVGLAVLGYAANEIRQAYTEDFRKHLDAEGTSGDTGSAYVAFGKAGYTAKGIAIAIVGGLFCYASVTHDAKKSGGLDQALQQILEQPYGSILLILVALGIGCYGLFCFARARHLSR